MANSITAFWDDSYLRCFPQKDVPETDPVAITRVLTLLNTLVWYEGVSRNSWTKVIMKYTTPNKRV
jgi:hypothetical protein